MVALVLALIIPMFAIIGGGVLLGKRVSRRITKRAERRRQLNTVAQRDAADPPGVIDTALLVDGLPPLDMERAKTLTIIGRDGACDVRLDHVSVATHHAAIERTAEDEFWLMDLTGPNGAGVRVDDRRIARHRLRGGERIAIGALTMSVLPVTARRS